MEKIKKENKKRVVKYICPIFRFATQTFFFIAPDEGSCCKPKYRANIIRHLIFLKFFFFYFFYHSYWRKDQVYCFKFKIWYSRFYWSRSTKDPVVACSRRSDSRARRSVGSELNCTPEERGGGGPFPPFPPLVFPRFFFFVNFSPALYYLNAWNRLIRWTHTRLSLWFCLHKCF